MLKQKGTNYYFSSLRMGVATQVKGAQTDLRPTLNLQIKTSAVTTQNKQKNKSAQVKMTLYGPGEVLGFDSNKVVSKVCPHDNNGNFNADLIPFIEFSEPDFLWRYSMDKGKGEHWNPWLTLIVLKASDGNKLSEFDFVSGSNTKLPSRIQLKNGAILPDLQESWRWAHVNFIGENNLNDIQVQERLKAKPHRAVCRLFSARALEKGVKYSAFVVPTYLLGRMAAFGETPPHGTNSAEKSWTGTNIPENAELPYYYYWDFRCGEKGGFEDLVKLIQPTNIGISGGKAFSTKEVGYGINDLDDIQNMLTALEPVGTNNKSVISKQLVGLLNKGEQKRLEANHETDNKVVPPIYGRWYGNEGGGQMLLDENKVNNSWLEQLNLDPRYRLIAGLGAEFVKQNQDELLTEAWQQIHTIQEENKRLQLGRFSRAIAQCMHKRIENIEKKDNLLQYTAPLHSKVMVEGESVNSNLRASTVPNIMFNNKFRKLVLKVAVKGSIITPPSDNQVVQSTFLASGVQWQESTSIAVDSITQNISAEEQVSLLEINEKAIREGINPLETIEQPLSNRIAPLRDWVENKKEEQGGNMIAVASSTIQDPLRPIKWYPQFHAPMYEQLRALSPDLIIPGLAEMPQNSAAICQVNKAFVEAFMVGLNHEFASELRWREFPTDMRGSYFRNFWDATIFSLDDDEREVFKTTKQGQRLLELLKINFQEIFSVNISDTECWNKLIAIYQIANPVDLELDVIDAYEEAVEAWLLTREEDKDIHPLHSWKRQSTLGSHLNEKQTDGEQIVLLIRAMLFQKYPNLFIYLAPKVNNEPDFTEAHRQYPVFEGQLPPDIEFVGFPSLNPENYFLVFEERLSEQRYGLDANKINNLGSSDGTDLDDLSWEHFGLSKGEYLDALQPQDNEAAGSWNSPAYIAKAMTQKPIRFALELNRFIT